MSQSKVQTEVIKHRNPEQPKDPDSGGKAANLSVGRKAGRDSLRACRKLVMGNMKVVEKGRLKN